DARHAIERRDEVSPDAALLREHLAACGGEPVVASAALPGFFDPAPVDQAFACEAVQRGVERGDVKRDGAIRAFVDQPADVVAVSILFFEEGEDHNFRAAAFQFALERCGHDVWSHHIWPRRATASARAHRPRPPTPTPPTPTPPTPF